MKKIAVINDLSGFGKCSLAVALPIISQHKIQCVPLTTGVFSNQTGYDSFEAVDLTEHMPKFIDEWRKLSPKFNAILTGFIPNSAQGEIISRFIDEFKSENTLTVVDPIMGDNGKIYPCHNEDTIKAIKNLSSKADIITPNLTELAILCNKEYTTDFEKIGQMAKSLNKTVIVTGIPFSESEIANAVYENGSFEIIKNKRLGGSFSGTGDILASFVTAQAVNGNSIVDAVKKATDFISKAIENTIKTPYDTRDGINFEKYLCEIR